MSTVGKIIEMLDQAEREIPRVKGAGDGAVTLMKEARVIVDSISSGLPDKALGGRIDAQTSAVNTAFGAILGLSQRIQNVKTDVRNAFGR